MPSRPPPQHRPSPNQRHRGRHMLQASILGVTAHRASLAKAAREARARIMRERREAIIRRENERLRQSTAAFGYSLESELTIPAYADLVRSGYNGVSNVDRLVHRVIPMLQKHVKKYPKSSQ